MNHVYRLKRSGRTQQLQPVPETARAAGKGSSTGKTLTQTVTATLASVALGGMASLAHAQQAPPAATQLPQGGVVTRGSANIVTGTINASNSSTTLMSVNQSSPRAVIDWASFNVGSQAKVQFNQPSSSAVVLNNILGNNASQIYGQISANGQVFLSNPNGVYFSPTAQVNVGGLVATTGKANADEFMAGKVTFNREGSTGSVVNEGQLQAALGGYIALLAPEVRNQGVVVAQAGTVALASGEAIALNFSNNATGLAGITTTAQAIAALVENRSAVLAEGGQIILSAHALAALQGSVVKNSGQLSATSLTEKGGKIVLMADSIELTGTSRIDANGPMGGGTVLVGGDWQGSGDTRQAVQVTMAQGASIEANATQQGDGGQVVLWSDVHNARSVTQVDGRIEAKGAGTGHGGQVETSGHALRVGDATRVNTSAPQGPAGQWLIDPTDFTVAAAGGDMSGATLGTNLGTGAVTIASTAGANTSTTNGSIFINDTVSWNANTLTLNAQNNVTVSKTLNLTGTAGLSVQYGQQSASASGNNALFTVNAPINIASTGSFATTLGSGLGSVSTNYTIVNSLGAAADATTAPASPSLQGMAKNLGTAFVLGSDIDATGTSSWNSNAGFTPIGNSTTAFSGKFNGLGHTITGLSIAASGADYQGLFGKTTGSVSNITLTGATVSGRSYAGTLAGYGADFYNVRILGGSVTGSAYVGGMAGYASSTIDTVNTSAAVSGVDAATTPARFIGGMLGAGAAAVNNTTSTGAVTATNTTASLATGSTGVSATSTGTLHSVGGLIGWLAPTASMTLAYNISTGAVTVTTAAASCASAAFCIANVGGLIGTLGGSASSTNGTWRVTVSDSSTSGNVSVASTTAASMLSQSTFIGMATGGVIGRVDYGGGTNLAFGGGLTLTNIASTGHVSGYSAVGGVLGLSNLGSTGTVGANVFSNLSASGNVTGFGSTAAITSPVNVTLTASSQGTSQGIGGLIGSNLGAKVAQITGSRYDGGTITSNGGPFMGGLVGVSSGLITDSYSSGEIVLPTTPFALGNPPSHSVTGAAGGLAGLLGGGSTAAGVSGLSYSKMNITVGTSGAPIGSAFVGGLVGYLAPVAGRDVSINGAYATGNILAYSVVPVTSSPFSYFYGGLIGQAATPTAITGTADVSSVTLTVATMTNNYLGVGTTIAGPGILPGTYITAVGTGSGGAGTYTLNQAQTLGTGLAITATPSGYINNSYATGQVAALNVSNVGGLAGSASAIFNSYATGNVSGNVSVGGLVGRGQTVYNSYALGNVAGTTSGGSISQYTAGLVGRLVGTISDGVANSYWTGQQVTGVNYVGGLVGLVDGQNALPLISNSYVTGSGLIQGSYYVGGLVGSISIGAINNSFSTATVTGSNSVGGLVGSFGNSSAAQYMPLLSNSWSSGNVTGQTLVGGAVGLSSGTLNSVYATGAVIASGTSASSPSVGGLIGSNLMGARVSNSFATGAVTSTWTGTNGQSVGGLIGFNQSSGSINNSYATGNVTVNGLAAAGGLIGYSAIPVVATTTTTTQNGQTASSGTTLNLSGGYGVGGVLGVGAVVSGAGLPANTTITAILGLASFTVNQTISIAAGSNSSLTVSNPTGSSSASIAGNTLTLGGTVTGYFAPGTAITGAGIPSGTYITGVLSTPSTLLNGFGGASSTYSLSQSATVSNVAITGINTAVSTYSRIPVAGFMVTNNLGGGFAVGMKITGPGIPANTTITGVASRYVGTTLTSGYTLSDSSFTITAPIAVVGQTVNPTISNVYSTGNVVLNAVSSTGYSYMGGLIGQLASGVTSSISSAYALGTVPLTAKVTTAVINSNTVVLAAPSAGSGLAVGASVSGTGVPAGTTITQIVSGTGAAGTYRLSNNVTLAADQYLNFTSATMGTVLRGGLIGYVGSGKTSNNNTSITNGTVVMPTLSGLYFNATSNTSLYGVGNDGVSNTGLSSGTLGLTLAQMRDKNNMPGLNFSTATLGSAASGIAGAGNYWVIVDADGTYNNDSGAAGATYPILASEYSLKLTSGHQLQLMGLDMSAAYVLQNSVSFTSTDVWSSTGFVPVGTTARPFTGSFTGSALFSGSQTVCPAYAGGCTISSLMINSAQTDPVGLFGTVGTGGTVSGARLLNASITGAGAVGAVVGSNAGTVSFSSATGAVTSTNTSSSPYGVGGLVGENSGTADRVFSTATVTAAQGSAMLAGGVVGLNSGTLSNAYAAGLGSISSGGYAGGLAGSNPGSIDKSYAAGPVAGSSTVAGGLAGLSAGSITNSFWDIDTTTQLAPVAGTTAVGSGGGSTSYGVGMTTANLQTLANYNSATAANGNVNPGWNLTSIWNPPVVGGVYPALRDFLIPITVTAKAVSKVYDGVAYSGPVSLSYSLPNITLSGTAAYDGSISGYTNAGSYPITPTGLYSNQYNVSFASGTLTITKRPLTFSISTVVPKVYDGTTALDPSNITINNLVGTQTLSVQSVSAVSSQVAANGANYISSITLGNATDGSGGLLANYSVPTTLTRANSQVTITPATVTLSGVTAQDKTYDGTTAATLSGGTLSGVVASDAALVSVTGTFASKNVASNIAVTPSLTGLSASNYTIAPSSLTANITRLNSVTWVGGATGDWLNPANWAATGNLAVTGAVPDQSNVANVVIPSGKTPSFSGTVVAPAQSGTVNVDSISGAGNLSVAAGTLTVGTGGINLASLTHSGGTLAFSGDSSLTTAASLTLGTVTATGALTLQSTTGDVTLAGNVSAGNAPLVVKATGNVVQNASTTVSSTGGSISYWADSDGNGAGLIALRDGTSAGTRAAVNAGAGDIMMGGGTGATAADGAAMGIKGISLGTYASLTGNNITLVGRAPANVGLTVGVEIGNYASVSGTGNVAITGTGGAQLVTDSSNNVGIKIGAATVETTGSGTLTVRGTGGGSGAGALNYGVNMTGLPGSVPTYSTLRTTSGDLTVVAVSNSVNGNVGLVSSSYALLGGVAQSGNVLVQGNSMSWPRDGRGSQINTTGAVTIEPALAGASFEMLSISGLSLASTISSLTIGRSGSVGEVSWDTTASIAGPVTLYGGMSMTANLTAAGQVSLYGPANVSVAGVMLTAPSVLAIGTGASNVTLPLTTNTFAGSGLGYVTLLNQGALTIGTVGGVTGISSSRAMDISTTTGNLTLAGNLATTTNWGYGAAIVLNASASSAALDASGGNVVVTGGSTITVGAGGNAIAYTGSVAGSTGLSALVGAGSGRFRYGSDETTKNYTTSLGAGLHAIYRERPTVSWSNAADQSIVYGQALTYSTTGSLSTYSTTGSYSSGLQNGDEAQVSQALLLRTATAPKTNAVMNSSSLYNVGVYEVSKTASAEALGYAGINPNITVTKAPLTVTVKNYTKTYDGGAFSGGTGVTYSGFYGSETSSVLGGALRYAGDAQGKSNAGTYSITASGLTANNYDISYNPGTLTINPKALTIRVNDDARFVGQADTVGYAGASYTGFVTGESISTLGSLSITRVPSGAIAPGTYSGALQASIPGLTNTNYTITYVPGNYTVVPADQLLVKFSNVATTYGSDPVYAVTSAQYLKSSTNTVIDLTSRATITGSLFNLTDGDGGATSFTVGPQSVTLSSAGKPNAFGGYQLAATSVTNSSSNYKNSITTTGALTVNPLAISASVSSGLAKTYDGNADMMGLGLNLTGTLVADKVSVSGQGVFASADAGTTNYTVKNLVLSGVDQGNYVLSSGNSISASNGSIARAALTITAQSDRKVYDGLEYLGGNGVVYSGLVNNESASVLSGTLSYSGDSQHAVNAGTYTITPQGLSSNNYTITYVNAPLTVVPVTITTSPVSVQLQGPVSKEYDGSDTATLTPANYILSGWVSTDSASITKTTGTYDSANVGSGKLVTVNLTSGDYQAGAGTVLSNYVLPTSVSGAVGTITPKPVTVSGLVAANKTYDGTSAVAITQWGSVATGVANQSLTLVPGSASFADANAQTGKTVTATGYALADGVGGAASNYVLTSTVSTTTADIAPKAVTVTGAARTTTYDAVSTYADLVSTTGFVTSGLAQNDWVSSVTKTLGGASSSAIAQAGTYTVTPGAAVMGAGLATNYSFNYVGATNTVDPATVSVTPISGSLQGVVSKVYDGTDTATLNSSHYLLTGWLNSEGATVTKTSGTYDNANAGSGKTVTVNLSNADYTANSGTNLANYTLPTTISGAVGTISKAPLTATGNSAQVTYNGANQTVSGFTVSGLQGNDTVGSLSSVVASGATAKNAGSYTNTVTAGTETNYIVTPVNGSLDIAKANATVTANSGTLTYNGANQTVSGFTASGLVGSETASVLTGVTASRTEKNAGTYATTASGTDVNYNLTFVDGSMVINRAALTVRANDDARVVTQNDAAGYQGASYIGLVGGEVPTALGGSLVISRSSSGPDGNTSATNALAGSYSGALTASGLSSSNYTISYAPGNYTVVPADQLLVKLTPTTSSYGATSTYNVAEAKYLNRSNVIVDLTGNVSRSGNSFTVSDGAGGSASFTVSPSGAVLSGAGELAAGSYRLGASGVSVASNNFGGNLTLVGSQTVNPVPVTPIPLVSKVYDGTTAMTSESVPLSGVRGADVVSALGTGAFASKNAGTNLGYSVTGLSLSGADAGNYYLIGGGNVSGSNGTITRAPLAVTFTAASKVYDGNAVAALSASDNRLANDVLTVLATGSFADKNVGAGKTVTVSGVSLSGADAGNYTVSATGNSTTASITRLPQVSWVGGSTGSWFDPANWAGGAVPDLANVASVSIPAGVTVSFNNVPVPPAQAGPVSIDSLGAAGSLALSAGSLNVGAGGATLNSLTQSGGALSSMVAVALGSLSQSAGSLVAGSLSTTTAYNQSGAGTIAVSGDVTIAATSTPVVLGNLNTGGRLNVNSTAGSMTQTAGTVISVAGEAVLSASVGGQLADVVLANAGNDFAGSVSVQAASSTISGASAGTNWPELPPVRSPALAQAMLPYALTVLSLPDRGDAQIHLALQDVLSDQQIPLPKELLDWLEARAGEPIQVGSDTAMQPGVAVSQDDSSLKLQSLANVNLPIQVVLKTAKGQAVVRIVKAP